ncbi:MAG TPA: right-handed parallel beta-helix repeat-containing protein, partial [Candidatus Babeliaceae bacterium]|nr:right-handed parallel beta-helix repeat-containing protein [Candidatus Babeliaceae bacterium]
QQALENSDFAELSLTLRQTLNELSQEKSMDPKLIEKAKDLTEALLHDVSSQVDEQGCAEQSVYRRKTTNLLCQIRQILCCCCQTLKQEVAQGNEALSRQIAAGFASTQESLTTLAEEVAIGFDAVLSHLPCTPKIAITSLPFTITTPGVYCLSDNMTFTGSGAAITISGTTNVKLDLSNRNLTLTNPAAVGILITDSSEIAVVNDAILLNAPSLETTSAAVQIVSSTKVILDGLETVNTAKGIWIQGSTDIQIANAHLLLHSLDATLAATQGAIRVESSRNIQVVNTVIESSGFGLYVLDGSQNIYVANSKFWNSLINVLLRDGQNALLENIEVLTNISEIAYNLSNVQFGAGTVFFNSALIKDSVIANSNPALGFDNIAAVFAQNITIANSTVSGAGAVDPSDDYEPAVIHLGVADSNDDPTLVANTIFIYNNTLSNTAPLSTARIIRVETGSSGITIDNNLISGAILDGVLYDGTTQTAIKNNEISRNGNNGILFRANTSANVVLNNQIISNGFDGVRLETHPADRNLVQNNQVIGNSNIGIEDLGGNNQVYYNSAFSNGVNQYSGVPVSLVGAPGSTPVTLGENIAA